MHKLTLITALVIVAAFVLVALAGYLADKAKRGRIVPTAYTGPVHPGQVVGFRPARKHERRGRLYPIFAMAGGAQTVLEQLQQRAQSERDEIAKLIAAPLPEDRAAAQAANKDIEQRQEAVAEIEARVKQLEAEEARRQADADARRQAGGPTPGPAIIGEEPQIYGRGSGNSYFHDLTTSTLRGDTDALGRLRRHAQELDVEMPAREARREARRREHEGRLHMLDRANGFEPQYTRTNPNRTDGQGGYFVPPLWLIDEYIPLIRAGRTTADLTTQLELPAGTDSINLPKVATGTKTGTQVDNGAVTSVDLTDTTVSAPVRTIAGQEDVAMQLLDQSPAPGFDQIVFADLIGDYNQQLDLQVIAGTGTSGQLKGVTVMSGSNPITYTDATPTVPELYLPLAQALSQVARQRLRPATAIVAAIQRAYWLLSALDGNQRPLVTPVGGPGASFNPLGSVNPGVAEGLLANVIGTNVYGDGNVPTNLGAGTNQDEIIAGKFDDAYLWEGMLRTRVLQEVLSGTLQVRLQLFNYVAFMPDRYPTSFSVIGGTGLVAPAGF